jgi:hypothetical protein
MTSTLVFHSVNDLPIGQRRGDGYFNATALCKAAGKRFSNYYQLESTTEYLQALQVDTGITASELVQVRKGGKSSEQGTWVHPEVAVDLAKWLSPQFRVLVNRWVVQWMSGTASQPQSQPSEPAQIKAWTPPELYPQMTQAEFEAIPVDEQWLYLETPLERRNRQRQELREIGYWTSRKHG